MHLKECGVFETIRVERGRAVLLEYHYARLKEGADLLGIPLSLSFNEFKELVEKGARSEEPVLKRFTLFCDGKFALRERKAKKRDSVSVTLVRDVRRCYSSVSAVKTIDIGASLFALKLAEKKGFDEALLLSSDGFVSEAAFANLFFIKGETLFTPSLKTGCLNGTRRRFILDLAKSMGISVVEGFFTVEDLYEADEVFLTSAREDAVFVSKLDDVVFRSEGKSWASRIRDIVVFTAI